MGLHGSAAATDRSGPLIRWLFATATLNVPQAASPIAFALLALGLTGEATDGAALILAMTLAQVVAVLPLSRIGRRFAPVGFLRALVLGRSLALAALALAAWLEASLGVLVVLAALAGLANGAAHGYLRVILNQLVTAARLPRALGLAATLNELTFVLAPVAASGLGVVSPVFAVLMLTALGALPALLVPSVAAPDPLPALPAAPSSVGTGIGAPIALWLLCATASGAAVAAIEIGAVALALDFGFEAAYAVLFTVPLCVASAAGGLWVGIRNLRATRRMVLVQLAIMSVGTLLVALQASLPVTMVGVVMMGVVTAPLGTHYSLTLDALARPQQRAEVFGLLRTANAVGIILTSSVLAFASLSMALMLVACLMLAATLCVGFGSPAAFAEAWRR